MIYVPPVPTCTVSQIDKQTSDLPYLEEEFINLRKSLAGKSCCLRPSLRVIIIIILSQCARLGHFGNSPCSLDTAHIQSKVQISSSSRTCTRIRSAGKEWLIFLILYSVKFVEIVIVGLAALQPSEDVE